METCLHILDSHHIVYLRGPLAKDNRKVKNSLEKPKLLARITNPFLFSVDYTCALRLLNKKDPLLLKLNDLIWGSSYKKFLCI